MAHTSVDVRTKMGDWPGRIGSAACARGAIRFACSSAPNINPGFSLLSQRNPYISVAPLSLQDPTRSKNHKPESLTKGV
jgi:hypothetical protein